MKPYYKKQRAKFFWGDAIAVLGELPASSVDFIFADPPYYLSNNGFTCHGGKRASVNKGKWDKGQGIDQDFNFHYQWISACKRILKSHGSLWISGTYHSIYACGFALQKQGWHLINDICWFKPNAAPNLSCRMFTASHETLLWARKDKKSKHIFNYETIKHAPWPGDFIKKPSRQMRSVWTVTTPKNAEKRYGKHPTQKPESLLERAIVAATQKDSVVLDPFCGSATTGVVALKHGLSFIGIDAEKKYLDNMAIPRIEDALLTGTGLQ